MAFTANFDLGQAIIAILISIVGYFVKKTIDKFDGRLDKHEDILFKMSGDVQLLKGMLNRRTELK